MQDEYIDIISANGKPTGKTALKTEAHKHGWYHNTIHVWLYNKDGEILLQQRSKNKQIHPLLWDVSAAGHIFAGESFIDAAIRETKEELGVELKANAFIKIGEQRHQNNYNKGTIKDYEFHQVYCAELPVKINQLTLQDNEVEAVKLVSFKTFQKLLNQSNTNNHFIASNQMYYQFVLQFISSLLKT